jgi:hypothetical protein
MGPSGNNRGHLSVSNDGTEHCECLEAWTGLKCEQLRENSTTLSPTLQPTTATLTPTQTGVDVVSIILYVSIGVAVIVSVVIIGGVLFFFFSSSAPPAGSVRIGSKRQRKKKRKVKDDENDENKRLNLDFMF